MPTPFVRLLLLLLLTLPALINISAQEAKPADPFIKGKGDAKRPDNPPPGGDGGAKAEKNDVPVHMLFTFESYSLPQEELNAIHEQTPKDPLFYERVRRLVQDGKASLQMLLSLPTRNGQRAASKSQDEIRNPTEFGPPVPGRNHGFPTNYEMEAMGESMEIDPVLRPDGQTVDVNMGPDFMRLAGFVLNKAGGEAEGELQPIVAVHDVTTAMTLQVDLPTLIGTVSKAQRTGVPEADGDGLVEVMFLTIRLTNLEPLPPAAPGAGDTANIRMVFRFYSLPRDAARNLLATTPNDVKLHSQLLTLPAEDLKLERLITLHTRSGQRATVEEVVQYNYGGELNPPHPPRGQTKQASATEPGAVGEAEAPGAGIKARTPPGFKKMEQRALGWRIEVDPVVGPDGRVIDLNLAPEHVEFRGNLEGHAMLANYPQQPVFGVQNITTAVTTIVDRPCFLGTFSNPRDTGVNGRKDDGRTWFAFVKVTLE